jgi:hypothetical protein
MPDEVKNKRNSEAQNNGSRKYIPYGRNTNKEYRHAADGENRSCNASTNRDLRHVDLRSSGIFFHRGAFWY